MSHVFNNSEYFEFRSKIYASIKKTLEVKIQQSADNYTGPLHPSDGADQILIDGAHFNFVYENQTSQLPAKLLDVKNLKHVLNMDNVTENFKDDELDELYSFLPEGHRNLQGIRYALEGKQQAKTEQPNDLVSEGKLIPESPLEEFDRKLKRGYFSSLREKEEAINERLNEDAMHKYYLSLLEDIKKERLEKHKKAPKDQRNQQESYVDSLNELEVDNQFSENSEITETQEQLLQDAEQEIPSGLFFKYDYSKIKAPEELLVMTEQRVDKKIGQIKTTLSARPKNQEWVDNYRKQQLLRYSNPTKAWVYTCEDGRKVTVAPVAKKMSVLTGKPRDHPMLKLQRPACVTILTLVRDAAARLPNGVGTRADICELLKESQYVNEDLPEDKVSSIVSGALDRLHYMTDACVKYDAEKKLWIYLHTERNHEHPGWGEDGEEYTEKKTHKKRKSDFQ